MQTIQTWRYPAGQQTLHKIFHTGEPANTALRFAVALCSCVLLLPQRSPAFSILDVHEESAEYRVQFESETNQYYRLYYTADLAHPAWTPLQMCLGTQNTQVISIPAVSPAPTSGFLRLSALPVDAREDADCDGYGDVMELQEGIDPQNMTNAPRLIHVHSFDGATKTNTFLYAPDYATSLGYVQYYNTGCLVGDGLGLDGSGGLNFIVPHGTSLFMQVYLSRNSWNSPHPDPGFYYRISFDARAEKKNPPTTPSCGPSSTSEPRSAPRPGHGRSRHGRTRPRHRFVRPRVLRRVARRRGRRAGKGAARVVELISI